jgi:predicted DCC family thiol-disulfide oxidoreductase YuxK
MKASQGKTSSNQDEMMRLLVFYDGQCPFCLGWVRFLLRRDGADRLRFASLQGDWAATFFRARGLERPGADSMLAWDGRRLHLESGAALRIAAALPWPWSWGRSLHLLPRGLRDGLYRWIARNRYRWFGRHEQCQLPGAGEARKILDQSPASGEEFLP